MHTLKVIPNTKSNDIYFIRQWLTILYRDNITDLLKSSLYGTKDRTIKGKQHVGKMAVPEEYVTPIKQSFYTRIERSINCDQKSRANRKYFNVCFKEAITQICRAIKKNGDSQDETELDNIQDSFASCSFDDGSGADQLAEDKYENVEYLSSFFDD